MRDLAAQRAIQFALFGAGIIALYSIFQRAADNPAAPENFDIPDTAGLFDRVGTASEFVLGSIAQVTGAKISRGFRNNNPGNLRDTTETWRGEIGPDANGYLMFSTLEDGLRALHRVLFNYGRKHSLSTIRGIITRWAPAEDDNDVGAYIAHVSRETGIGPDQPVNVDSPSDMLPLAHAIVLHENGYDTTTTEQQFAAFTAARN
jgi:hypothetical protein